ncbi:MAG: DUF2235 domain-containing protein, partial [Acidobacteria bacterium]|nr:DUF2235 domain-containing protein [Acidobacteriota bacterium]
KLFKTNVWRIYDALDLRDPDRQVACYDDGVGTSTFAPLAILGGAVGFGLKRNVLRLYRFLCEQYEPGDQIYAFGFSRGAFTIRMLVALIADQGIVRVRADKYVGATGAPPPASGPAGDGLARTTMTGSELRRLSKRAYQRFRFNKFDHGRQPLVRLARALRNAFARLRDGRRTYVPGCNYHLPEGGIRFVGLWDTVDAYGLPIDELTKGVDTWIWPLSFPELELSRVVAKACHALSLDDERHTFHPVLWDESKETVDAANGLDGERISQVWFAGVHANVGGGYPNDALSAVSLHWIAEEAANRDLIFLDEMLRHATEKRDPLGRMYDSRRGLAGYYRYNPRKIEYLTNGQTHEQGFFGGTWPKPRPTVKIARPKIHESVFTRIQAAPDFYAPIGLPKDYAVVTAAGRILSGADNAYESAAESAMRVRAQEVAWNLVWWRRIVYFMAVFVSLGMLVWPLRDDADAIVEIAERGGRSRIVEFMGGFLPQMASPWVNYYAAAPLELAVWLALLAAALWAGRTVRASIGDCMHRIWRYVLAKVPPPELTLPEPRGMLYRARQHPYYHGSFAVFRRLLLPHAFGLLVFSYLVGGANRIAFEAAHTVGLLCTDSAATTPVGPERVQRAFVTGASCAGTGLRLEPGEQYEMTVAFAGASDGSVPVTRSAGFGVLSTGLTLRQRTVFLLASPFKRVWRANWFAVVARVGPGGVEQIPLRGRPTRFTARNGGELFVFVNDAIAPVAYLAGIGTRFGWSAFYGNNSGAAIVTIRLVTAGT